VVSGLDLDVEQAVELVRRDARRDDDLEVVADEVQEVLLLRDGRELPEQRALIGVLDVRLDGDEPLLADLGEHLVQQRQQLEVMLLAVIGRPEDGADAAGDLRDDLGRRGDEERADGRAADDHELRRLEQDGEVPVLHQVPADDGHHDHPNRCGRHLSPPSRPSRRRRRRRGGSGAPLRRRVGGDRTELGVPGPDGAREAPRAAEEQREDLVARAVESSQLEENRAFDIGSCRCAPPRPPCTRIT
jgi:hypothetical protein